MATLAYLNGSWTDTQEDLLIPPKHEMITSGGGGMLRMQNVAMSITNHTTDLEVLLKDSKVLTEAISLIV
tara:strand:+ start:263 stop:472 length:210 start_codon:yes stop_codon:yes gene_type:complete